MLRQRGSPVQTPMPAHAPALEGGAQGSLSRERAKRVAGRKWGSEKPGACTTPWPTAPARAPAGSSSPAPRSRGWRVQGERGVDAASEARLDAEGAAGDVLQLPGHVVGHADAVVRQHLQHEPQVQPPLLPGHAVPGAGQGQCQRAGSAAGLAVPAAARVRVRGRRQGRGSSQACPLGTPGCCVGVLSLWGPHPGGLSRPSTPSDLTIADLYPLTLTLYPVGGGQGKPCGVRAECSHTPLPAHSPQAGLGPAVRPLFGGTHSKSVSFLSSVTGLKATTFFCRPITQAESGALANTRPVDIGA